MLLLMARSWHERSLEAISRCGRKPRAAVIHPAAGGGRRGEQAAAAMVSGQIGEARGGPPKPPAGTRPCARPGAAARGHPQPWKRPCTHKTPVANFSSSQGGSCSSDCRLGPKRKRVGRAGRGESISRPQESGLGGPCPRLPAPQTPPCFRGRSPCLIPQPQIIPLSPPEHHAAQPCPAAARRIPQLLAFLPRSHPRHLQSIARSLKIRCPPRYLNIKPPSSQGCCEAGPTLPPQGGTDLPGAAPREGRSHPTHPVPHPRGRVPARS